MPSTLAHARCFQHLGREAVARCPECTRFFCRECVTEHEGRMICQSCLGDLLDEGPEAKASWGRTLGGWLMAGVGLVIAVAVFYLLGRLLLRIPSNFHSGVFFD